MKLHPILLLITLCTARALAEPAPAAPNSALPAMTSRQLLINVAEEAVPVANKAGKVNLLKVTLKKMNSCNGKVSIKVCFIGKDLAVQKSVVHSAETQEGEAVGGAGNTYEFKSPPFNFTPSMPAGPAKGSAKAKPEVPAKGHKPQGWIVQVFQGKQLVDTMESGQGYEPLIDAYEKEVAAAKSKTKAATPK